MYEDYFQRYELAISKLEQTVRENPEVAKLLNQIQEVVASTSKVDLPLGHLLIQPVQRIPRYM